MLRGKRTPFLVYSLEELEASYRRIRDHFQYEDFLQLIPLKTNPLPPLLRAAFSMGMGADVCSVEEMNLAISQGCRRELISFTGIGLNESEMDEIAFEGIGALHLDSVQELEMWCRKWPGTGIGIRLNLDTRIDERCGCIYVGAESKMGIKPPDFPAVERIIKDSGCRLVGLHCHLAPFAKSSLEYIRRIESLIERCPSFMFDEIEYFNAGGGWPALMREGGSWDPRELAEGLEKICKEISSRANRSVQLRIEPGEHLLASCGAMISEVRVVKDIPGEERRILILDALLPPIECPLHKEPSIPLSVLGRKRQEFENYEYAIYGRNNTARDYITKSWRAPRLFPGDTVSIGMCGAYVGVLISRFNWREPPEQWVITKEGRVVSEEDG